MFTQPVAGPLDVPRHLVQQPAQDSRIALRPSNPVGSRFDSAQLRNVRAHEHLFREGGPRLQVYLVTQGVFVQYRLLSNGRRQVTGFARTGDVLGLGLANNYQCTAEASSPAKVRSLSASVFQRSAQVDPELSLWLHQAVSRELETIQDLLLAVGRLDAGQRLATFLVGLSDRRDGRSYGGDPIELPMTRCDIADYLGLTTETVSRCITKLVNRGIIARAGGSLCILDADALQAVALGDELL